MENHKFKDTQTINLARYSQGHTPGTYHFCVYMYAQSPSATEPHKDVTYKVTP